MKCAVGDAQCFCPDRKGAKTKQTEVRHLKVQKLFIAFEDLQVWTLAVGDWLLGGEYFRLLW